VLRGGILYYVDSIELSERGLLRSNEDRIIFIPDISEIA
jgi:hypothetical protein